MDETKDKKAVCGVFDLPDQTAASLTNYGYAAVAVEVVLVAFYTLYAVTSFDMEDPKDLDEFRFAPTNASADKLMAIIMGMAVLAGGSSLYGFGTLDRGFLMLATILHVLVVTAASVILPVTEVVIVGLFVQAVGLTAAWLTFRVSEKIQEEEDASSTTNADADADSDAAKTAGCDLPDLTLGRYRILIAVVGVICIGLGVANAILQLELGPEYQVGDYWQLGFLVVVGSAASMTGSYFMHRTSLIVCNTLCLLALSGFGFSIPLPLILEDQQEITCELIPASNTAGRDNCDKQLALARAWMAIYFVTMVFVTGLTWLVWRFSEALQSGNLEGVKEDLDTDLADEFSCCGITVSNPVSFYSKIVYGAAVFFILMAIGSFVLAGVSGENGQEKGFRKRALVLGGYQVLASIVSVAGAQARDRGLLVFAFLVQTVFVATAVLITFVNASLVDADTYAESYTKAFERHGVNIYGSSVNVQFSAQNPATAEQEDRALYATILAAATVIVALVTTPMIALLNEALQDEDDTAATNDDSAYDAAYDAADGYGTYDDEYTYATAESVNDQYSGQYSASGSASGNGTTASPSASAATYSSSASSASGSGSSS